MTDRLVLGCYMWYRHPTQSPPNCTKRIGPSVYQLHIIQYDTLIISAPKRVKVLRRCWLGGRKGIRPVKTEWWGTGMVICLERGANDVPMV